jgi:hypothetical protein
VNKHYVLVNDKIVGIRRGFPKYCFRQLSNGATESYKMIKSKRTLIINNRR